MIANTRARKRDSKLYLRKLWDDADDTAVRLLWPHTPTSLDFEPFLVKIEENGASVDADIKKEAADAPIQSEEGTCVRLRLEMPLKEEGL